MYILLCRLSHYISVWEGSILEYDISLAVKRDKMLSQVLGNSLSEDLLAITRKLALCF